MTSLYDIVKILSRDAAGLGVIKINLSKREFASKFQLWWPKYKHFSLLSLYGLCQLWFMYCEKNIRPRYFMYSIIDSYIPFIKVFVIPYLFWFAYMALGLIYLGIVSKKDYYRLCVFMFGGMCVCYTIYMLFPNAQNLRPIITDDDILSRIIRHIYATDTNTNVAPSIHVYNSIAVHVALVNCPEFNKEGKFWKYASFVSMVLISLSTVFIKQHSIKDGIWAAALAFVFYIFIYHLPKWLSTKHFTIPWAKEATMD